MMFFCEIDKSADIITDLVTAVRSRRGNIENLCSQGKSFGHVTLPLPAEEPIILVAGTRIDPVTAAAIGLPWTPALLKPEGQEKLSIPVA